MTKRILMIAYHFPPLQGSSGIQRTLSFVQHLPKFGWEPLVLTANERAYEAKSPDQLADILPSTIVHRAFGLDTARHLAIGGRYFQRLALPDRWASWAIGGVLSGLSMIRRYRPDVIWSTFPIASAHVIGATLAKWSGLPWVADFRDPMAHEGFPPDPAQWQAYLRVEQKVVRYASRMVFVTPGAAQLYADTYPQMADRIHIIENGYDEEAFSSIEKNKSSMTFGKDKKRPFVLLHSGLVYPSERDPRALFAALARLKSKKALSSETFCLRMRASGQAQWLSRLAADYQITDLVALEPALPYREALREMMESDGLLILQASNCNQQIPAKLYEYIRSGRPVLALTDPVGDTASAMRRAGLISIVRIDQVEQIESELLAFIDRIGSSAESLPHQDMRAQNSRQSRTAELAELLGSGI